MEDVKKPTLLSVLFGINEGTNNEYEDGKLEPEQIEAQSRANEMGRITEKPIVTAGRKSSNNGEFSNEIKIDPNTLGNMRNVKEGGTVEKQVKKSQEYGNEKI